VFKRVDVMPDVPTLELELSGPRTRKYSDVLATDCLSNFGRRTPVKTLERPIEIGKITKARLQCYPRNAAIAPASIGQHAVCARKAATKHKF
jgi:hypothetical protein